MIDRASALNVAVIGGGPAGLYFASTFANHCVGSRVTVFERLALESKDRGVGYTLAPETMSLMQQLSPSLSRKHVEGRPSWQTIELSHLDQIARIKTDWTLGITGDGLVEFLRECCAESGVVTTNATNIDNSDLRSINLEYDLVVIATGARSCLKDKSLWEDQCDYVVGNNMFYWTRVEMASDILSIAIDTIDGIKVIFTTYPISHEESCVIIECSEENYLCTKDDVFLNHLARRLRLNGFTSASISSEAKTWRRSRLSRALTLQRDKIVVIGDASCSFHFSLGIGLFFALETGRVLRVALTMTPDVGTALSIYERSIWNVLQRVQQRSVRRMRLFDGVATGSTNGLEQIVREYVGYSS